MFYTYGPLDVMRAFRPVSFSFVFLYLTSNQSKWPVSYIDDIIPTVLGVRRVSNNLSTLRPVSTEPIFFPHPSFHMGVVGQSQPSVRWEGTNRVHWPVSKKPMSTKLIFLMYVSLPFDIRQEKRLSGHGPLHCGHKHQRTQNSPPLQAIASSMLINLQAINNMMK